MCLSFNLVEWYCSSWKRAWEVCHEVELYSLRLLDSYMLFHVSMGDTILVPSLCI